MMKRIKSMMKTKKSTKCQQVLQFNCIPAHLQKKIVEKMEFSDIMNLFESSKAGRGLENILKYLGTKYCESIYFSKDGVRFEFIKNREWGDLTLEQIKEHICWPRFPTHCLYINEDITNEKCKAIIKDLTEENFLAEIETVRLAPPIEMLDMDLFRQLIEITNSKQFANRGHLNHLVIDPIYMRQPIIQQMERVDWQGNVEDDAILALEATTIIVHSISPHIKSTINAFFKQWLNNERKIVYFQIYEQTKVKWTREDREEMLDDLPYTTIWTPETHKSSPISKLSLDKIKKKRPTIVDGSYHFLLHEGKFLFISFDFYKCSFVQAKEVSDVKRELWEHLDGDTYRKLTGLCLGCKQKQCTCTLCPCCA